ncbi:MAG: pilus assembly protein PilM [Candidatus Magasanikbacteria bacterium]
MSLFGSEEQTYVGVDIGSGGIKVVELKEEKERPQLWTYGMVENPIDIHLDTADSTPEEHTKESGDIVLPEDQDNNTPEEMQLDEEKVNKCAGTLEKLIKQSKVKGDEVTASLPVSFVFHTIVTVPEMEEDDLSEVIKAEVDKLINRPVDEMQIVHREIPNSEDSDYQRFLVTAAPKKLVKFYSAIFQKAGLQLQELETEAFSLQRSLVGDDPSTVLVVDIGTERSNFFIMDQGLPMTHRSIEVGGETIDTILSDITDLKQQDITQVKKDVSRLQEQDIDPSPFEQLTDPLIKEIEYGFDLYAHQSGNENKRPEKIILTGGSSFFPPIAKALRDYFDMKVFIGDPWAHVVYQQGLKQILDEIGPRMSVSIGLALRNLV